ncbi:MAG: cellulase family glycosylhydrolase, partial [Planctomycetota bacterium]
LQYLVWEHDPDGFKQRMDQFLAICHKRGIRVVFCLFDDCVFGPKHDPYLGKQADVVPGWYAHDWSPSPGWSRVKDPKTWPKLQEYVRDVLTRFKDDPRVLIWDLYNEPTNGIGDATLPLLTKVVDWARLVNPSQPLTVGVWSENRQLNDLAISRSDVITFHRYSNALQLEAFIRSLQKHDRPLICTEWLKRNWGSVGDLLPVFVRHRVGCLHWGLVNGKTQTQYPWGSKAGAPEPKKWQHDLFRKDRTPYDSGEIELFKQSIARSQAQNATNGEGKPQVGARDTTQSMRYPPNEAATAWSSKPPADCPFEKSTDLNSIAFTGRHKEYTTADTWYPSWASDGNLYSPFTDGAVNEVRCHSGPRDWVTGNARIEGDDPLNLKIVPLGVHKAPAAPYGGRYPCGSLVHNGIWYYGTYCLDWYKYPWDVMGPFVGFRISRDEGRTWEDKFCTPEKPLFGEAIKRLDPHAVVPQKPGPNVSADQFRNMPKVKMGSPHFVDFGKNMEHSHDGKAYLTGHGTTQSEATCSWISGDQVYLARVTPSPENVNDVTKYEFFAGHDAQGQPVWIKDFTKIKPLAEWKDRSGCVTMTYFAALKRYLMCVTDGGRTGNGPYNTWIVESQQITGPWRLVTYLERFGEQAYFVNVPSKFINSDGRTAWLCYSHGWQHQSGNPPGSRYAMNLREFKVLGPSGQ